MIRVSNSAAQNNASPSSGGGIRRAAQGNQDAVNPLGADQSRRAAAHSGNDVPAGAAGQFALNAPENPPESSKQNRASKSDDSNLSANEYRRKRGLHSEDVLHAGRQRYTDDAIRGQFVGDGGYSRLARQAIEAYKDNHDQDVQSHVQKVMGIDTYA